MRILMGALAFAALASASACTLEDDVESNDEALAGETLGDVETENADLLVSAASATTDAPEQEIGPMSAADCERGANGFRDIPDTLRGTEVFPPFDMVGARIILYRGPLAGGQRGWAMIDGQTLPGDLVWMDWTRDGGASWIQCGPFQVTANGQTKTSAAQRTSSDPRWQFRACGHVSPVGTRCGPWW